MRLAEFIIRVEIRCLLSHLALVEFHQNSLNPSFVPITLLHESLRDMQTRVIWRLRERNALQRCIKLAFPLAPASENPPGSSRDIAAKFANDVSRFPDKVWTTSDFASEPFAWRAGRIRIQFQFVPPTRVVKVLSVEVVDVHDGPYVSYPKV